MQEKTLFEKIQKQVKKLSQMEFYRNKFDECGLNPRHLKTMDDFRKIPFMTSHDVQKDLDNHPPLGSLFHPASVRIHFSPGPDGLMPVPFTVQDIKQINRANAQCFQAAGITSEDIVAVTFGYHLFIAGLSIQGGFEAVGCKTIPIGPGNAERTADIINRFGVTVLAANPSFAVRLAEEGVKGIKILFAGGEPLSSVEGFKEKIRSLFGEITLIDAYGLAQAAPLARECRYETGLHVIDELFFVEIIDPESGDTLPYGQMGEIVITHLTKESSPLLRFRTGDLSVLKHFNCACGRKITLPKGVIGSAKEMIKVKGVKLYPSLISQVLKSFSGLTGKYRVLISSQGSADFFKILVESDEIEEFDLSFLKRGLNLAFLFNPDEIEVVKVLEDGPLIEDDRLSTQ